MLARRDATEREVAAAIGKLVFIYSRFVTGLHLCVAWLEDGKHLKDYPEVAESLVVAELLKRIEKRASAKFGRQSSGFRAYKNWLRRAHQLREVRNIVMHSRWGIEPYGRHAIAVSTPVFVEPPEETTFTADQLQVICERCSQLIGDLNGLREAHPL
jgi:hypothetical protein